MTWDEFENLTLANIEALEERRNVALRYDRFNAALVACAMTGHDNPYDFVPGMEPTEKDVTLHSYKNAIVQAMSRMNPKTPEEHEAVKAKLVSRLAKKIGADEANQLFEEVFPKWTN